MTNASLREFKIRIITLSDRAARGEYEDLSGEALKVDIQAFFKTKYIACNIGKLLIPDDANLLRAAIEDFVKDGIDIIFTTGGTGIGPRDITPETVKPMLNKELPGVMELIRVKYGMEKPGALLSRSIAGTIGACQVYCLPGSVKAVKEYFSEISKTMLHADRMLQGLDEH